MKKPTQEQRLIKKLLDGERITPLYALHHLGIYRLSARIFDLREKGWDIETSYITVQNADGTKSEVAEYRLKQ